MMDMRFWIPYSSGRKEDLPAWYSWPIYQMVSVIIVLDLLTFVLTGRHFEGLWNSWILLESLWDERWREKSTTRVHMCCVVIVSQRRCQRHCHTEINILSQRDRIWRHNAGTTLRRVCSP